MTMVRARRRNRANDERILCNEIYNIFFRLVLKGVNEYIASENVYYAIRLVGDCYVACKPDPRRANLISAEVAKFKHVHALEFFFLALFLQHSI